MKALTLWQPWAQAIALGLKQIETRSWATNHRGPLAIHAAKRPLPDMARWAGIFPDISEGAFPLGCIVAITSVVDCVEMTDKLIKELSPVERALGHYEPGRFAWILGPIFPLPSPIFISGHQGLWNFNGL